VKPATPNPSAMAEALKQEGNRYFKAGQYDLAIGKYSESIEVDGGKNYLLYTNRAFARLKLQQWEKVIQDCKASLALNTRNNIKGYYFMSQAQLESDPPLSKEALSNGLQAYELCVVHEDSKSMSNVVSQILKCKKAIWEEKNAPLEAEKRRLFENIKTLMLEKLDSTISALPQGDLSTPSSQISRETLERNHAADLRCLEESLFKRPEVPNWLIDDISFACMHDPVMTKNGKSYERATITEHLRRSQTDPVTRDPLVVGDLIPNLPLAQACDEFLRENGWAVDY